MSAAPPSDTTLARRAVALLLGAAGRPLVAQPQGVGDTLVTAGDAGFRVVRRGGWSPVRESAGDVLVDVLPAERIEPPPRTRGVMFGPGGTVYDLNDRAGLGGYVRAAGAPPSPDGLRAAEVAWLVSRYLGGEPPLHRPQNLLYAPDPLADHVGHRLPAGVIPFIESGADGAGGLWLRFSTYYLEPDERGVRRVGVNTWSVRLDRDGLTWSVQRVARQMPSRWYPSASRGELWRQ